MTFDEKLEQAFKETSDERTERLMEVEKNHKFSLAYKIWEYKTLRDLRRGRSDNHWSLQKVKKATTIMLVVFSFLILSGTAFAAVVIFGRYGFEDKVECTKVILERHSSDKTNFEEYYGLPEEEGWELKHSAIGEIGTMLDYTKGDKKVCFCQRIIVDGVNSYVNTEKASVVMLALYSEDDGFIMEFPDNATLLFWIYDGYLFELVGNLDKDSMINLAYSTKIVDFKKINI